MFTTIYYPWCAWKLLFAVEPALETVYAWLKNPKFWNKNNTKLMISFSINPGPDEPG